MNIARLILDLHAGETVEYVTTNRLDLRPENIVRAGGFAKGKETHAVANAAVAA